MSNSNLKYPFNLAILPLKTRLTILITKATLFDVIRLQKQRWMTGCISKRQENKSGLYTIVLSICSVGPVKIQQLSDIVKVPE